MNSDLLLYILLYTVAELRKNNCDSHKVGVHTMHAGGCLFEKGRPSPAYYPIVQTLWDAVADSGGGGPGPPFGKEKKCKRAH